MDEYEVTSFQKQLLAKRNTRIALELEISRRYSVDDVKASLNSVIDRFEVLRTYYPSSLDCRKFVQSIRDSSALWVSYEESQNLNSSNSFHKEPVIAFLSKKQGSTLLCLSFLAASFDQRSLEIFLHYFSSHLDSKDCMSPIVQFADYAGWLNAQTNNIDIQPGDDERKRLFPSGIFNSLDGGSVVKTISSSPKDLSNQLKALSEKLNKTTEETLYSVWAMLLEKLFSDRFTLHLVKDRRAGVGLENSIGPISNLEPIRMHEFEHMRSISCLRALEKNIFAIREKKHSVNFNSTIEGVKIAARWFNYKAIDRKNVKVVGKLKSGQFEPVQIELVAHEYADEIEVELSYESGFISQSYASEILDQFCSLVTEIVEFPDKLLSQLDLRSDLQKKQHSDYFQYFDDKTYEDFMAVLLDNQSNDLALIYNAKNQKVTYQDLFKKVKSVAGYLEGVGVKSGDRVGVFLERDMDVIVSILAISLLNACFIPFDISTPAGRVRQQLKEAKAKFCISTPDDLTVVSGVCQHLPIGYVDGWQATREWDPDSIAYIIFTSGSTGKSKGVVISRRNLSYYVDAMNNVLGLQANDSILHVAPLGFSSAVRQLFVPLAAGASIVLSGDNERRDAASLLQLIEKSGVTILDLVPSHAGSFINYLGNTNKIAQLQNSSLRIFTSASEPLHSSLVYRLRESLPEKCVLYNMYGQTETTGIVSLFPIGLNLTDPVSLGFPLKGTCLIIVNSINQIQAAGVIGEICIAGPGVFAGYIDGGRDAFFSIRNQTVYKTGDLGCLMPDGSIFYVGRSDGRVKVRGFRVDLLEIQKTIINHPAVDNAVVVLVDEYGVDSFLGACIVPAVGQRPTYTDIAELIAEQLPSYMVPQRIKLVREFPNKESGKTDIIKVKNLLLNDGNYIESDDFPSTLTEEKIERIWARRLAREKIGIHEDFFDLGGQSLIAMEILADAEVDFGVKLGWNAINKASSISEFASEIDKLVEQT